MAKGKEKKKGEKQLDHAVQAPTEGERKSTHPDFVDFCGPIYDTKGRLLHAALPYKPKKEVSSTVSSSQSSQKSYTNIEETLKRRLSRTALEEADIIEATAVSGSRSLLHIAERFKAKRLKLASGSADVHGGVRVKQEPLDESNNSNILALLETSPAATVPTKRSTPPEGAGMSSGKRNKLMVSKSSLTSKPMVAAADAESKASPLETAGTGNTKEASEEHKVPDKGLVPQNLEDFDFIELPQVNPQSPRRNFIQSDLIRHANKGADWYNLQGQDYTKIHAEVEMDLFQMTKGYRSLIPLKYKFSQKELEGVQARFLAHNSFTSHQDYVELVYRLSEQRKTQLLLEVSTYQELLDVKERLAESKKALQEALSRE